MSKDLQEQPRTGEVDIIQIFNLIGNAFKRFFNFLYSILEYIFNFLLIISLFVKKNIKLFLFALIIGAICGFVYDQYKKSHYISFMTVEPNYGINLQVINNIYLYGQLARSKDSVTLSNMLSISQSEASQLLNIKIEPLNNINEQLKLYNEFVKTSDTAVTNKISFEDFSNKTTMQEYRQYRITVESKDRNVFRKIENTLTNIPVTDYTKQVQKVDLNNIEEQIKSVNSSLEKVEQLRADYKQLMLQEVSVDESKPKSSGTNFYLGSTENIRPTNELELFKIEENYRTQLNKLASEKSRKSNFVNVISGFQDIGLRVKEKYKYWFILGSLGIAVVFLLLKQFNTFLNNYEKKLASKK